MAYGNSFGNNDLSMRNGNYGGLYSVCFTSKTAFNSAYSLDAAIDENHEPKIDTDRGATNNNGFSYVRNKDRMFFTNLYGFTGCAVRFGSPFITSYSLASSSSYVNGYKNVGLSNNQNYINIQASMSYGYTFAGWRLNSSSGTLITFSSNTNLFYNSSYGSVNFQWIYNIYSSSIS